MHDFCEFRGVFEDFCIKIVIQEKFDFPLSSKAVEVNKKMTFDVMSEIRDKFNKKIFGKKVLLIGVSYREDTNDMRYSPAVDLLKAIKLKGAKVSIYDPYYTSANNSDKLDFIDCFKTNFDIILFCVAHSEFKKISLKSLKNKIIFDLNRVLTDNQKNSINKRKNNSFYLDS